MLYIYACLPLPVSSLPSFAEAVTPRIFLELSVSIEAVGSSEALVEIACAATKSRLATMFWSLAVRLSVTDKPSTTAAMVMLLALWALRSQSSITATAFPTRYLYNSPPAAVPI